MFPVLLESDNLSIFGANPYVFGGIALVALIVALAIVMNIGASSPHSK